MFFLYSLLAGFAFLILLLPEYLKRPHELRKRWLAEKLGSFGALDRSIWFHAVSVGEVNAVIPLLHKLRAAVPDMPFVLSTVTDTGQRVAAEKSPDGTTVVYLPFDIPFIIRKAIRRVSPRALVVIETELWPNLFRTAESRGIPVVVLNGRISERSARGYRRVSFFMKPVLSSCTLLGMQSRADADRILSFGAPQDRVQVTGNFKFDLAVAGATPAWASGLKGPVIVAGSTHNGEETLVLEAYRENLVHFPSLTLVLAPRHPERFDAVEDILKESGLAYRRRTELGSAAAAQAPAPCVILLDTVGELSSVYRIADIAVVGKSFLGFGGQNPLEPAYWGKPVLCGPHMENFPFISDFYREGGAFEVDSHTLAKKIKGLLIEPERAVEAGRRAQELFRKNAGAVDRAAELILSCLKRPQ